MWRVAIYAQEVAGLAAKVARQPGWGHVASYGDLSLSGSRPGLARLLIDAADRFDVVVVDGFARLSPIRHQLASILDQLHWAGVGVVVLEPSAGPPVRETGGEPRPRRSDRRSRALIQGRLLRHPCHSRQLVCRPPGGSGSRDGSTGRGGAGRGWRRLSLYPAGWQAEPVRDIAATGFTGEGQDRAERQGRVEPHGAQRAAGDLACGSALRTADPGIETRAWRDR
jgi:hypothetical protein